MSVKITYEQFDNYNIDVKHRCCKETNNFSILSAGLSTSVKDFDVNHVILIIHCKIDNQLIDLKKIFLKDDYYTNCVTVYNIEGDGYRYFKPYELPTTDLIYYHNVYIKI